jgi:hypothetical protein
MPDEIGDDQEVADEPGFLDDIQFELETVQDLLERGPFDRLAILFPGIRGRFGPGGIRQSRVILDAIDDETLIRSPGCGCRSVAPGLRRASDAAGNPRG